MLLKYLAKLKILMRFTPEQWNFPKEALSPLYREEHFVCRKKKCFLVGCQKERRREQAELSRAGRLS